MKDFNHSLFDRLKNHDYTHTYLNIALEEFENDGNISAFLTALRHIAQAQGGIAKLSQSTKLNKPNLYKQLSKNGNPSFKTIDHVLNSLGFKINITTIQSTHID